MKKIVIVDGGSRQNMNTAQKLPTLLSSQWQH